MKDMDGNEIKVGDILTEDYRNFFEVISNNGISLTLKHVTQGFRKEVLDCILDCNWQVYN